MLIQFFGIDFVEGIRKKIETRTNRPCIPVWHKGRGVEYWKYMCDNYSYVAIGGLVFHVKKSEYELIRQMVDYAYYKNIKVHGLGFTKVNELEHYKFYSVDSASWVKGASLGPHRHDFDGTKMIMRKIHKKNIKVLLDKLVNYNGIQWCKYQKYMDKKGY